MVDAEEIDPEAQLQAMTTDQVMMAYWMAATELERRGILVEDTDEVDWH